MARTRSYQDDLLKALQDPEEARAYLNAALEDGNLQVFLLALQDAIDAKIKVIQLSEKSQSSFESLDKIFSESSNSELAHLKHLLENLGYRLSTTTLNK
jgi:DNA-binding phage protein